MAREAGVSPITVSRALNLPHLVRRETRERVNGAVIRTGYIVNSAASTLKSGRSNIVTVFIASLQNPHLSAEAQGIIDAFDGSLFRLMFTQTGWRGQLTADLIDPVRSFRPAGIILAGVGGDQTTRRSLIGLETPIVEMGERAQPMDILIQYSSFEAGRLMGEHFGRCGYRRVAFCGHTLDHGERRLQGFQSALEVIGLKPPLVVPIEGTQSVSDGAASLERILSKAPECEAIFYGSDLLAMGAQLEAQRRKIRVPVDLAISGYGDLDFARHLDPPLTTIKVSDYDVGRVAGEKLLSRLNGGKALPQIVNLPIDLVARQSTGHPKM